MKSRRSKHLLRRFGLWFMVALICFYMLFPVWWTIISSLKSQAQLQMMPATMLPRNPVTGAIQFYFKNYLHVITDPAFLRGLFNSCIVAGSSTLIALCIGAFSGFAIGKLRFKGKKVSMYTILVMSMFPAVSLLSGLYAIMNEIHAPPLISLILVYQISVLPLTTWFLAAFFRNLPTELLQSAQVDGATPMQTFWHILLPLTAPALVTTGILAFTGAWNEYLYALTFTTIDKSARTVPVAIALFSGVVAKQQPFGEILAASIIVSVPIIILVLIFQNRIIGGLTSGSVKG
ncbi:MAG TPA: carbohydrate ABC transporter permease [Victivallales bacterium]|nr:carbohydrate ABC transporter permease [Victivallales bacterium]